MTADPFLREARETYAKANAGTLRWMLARPMLSTRGAVALALAAFGARWTHELAFTLAAVPAVAFVFATAGRRVEWLRRAAWLVAGLVAGQLALFAVHALAPPTNGDVMVRRFFLWQVLNLFERPPLDLPPVELGQRSYQMRGCTQCHSIDGSKLVGPSFAGFAAR